MPAASTMKRHSAPAPSSTTTTSPPPPTQAGPSPPPLPPQRIASPVHPSRPPYNDDGDAASLTSVGSDGDKKVKPAQSFEALFNCEKMSDFLLDVNHGQYVFHAHKMIVGLKSERLAALITTSTNSGSSLGGGGGGGGSDGGIGNSCSNGNISGLSMSKSMNNNTISPSNTSTFTAGNTAGEKEKCSPNESPGSGCVKPTLHLHESPDCGAVFGRFLYFIYSGAVWLHRDYVLPLHVLSIKYGVAALAAHCENYIQQLLHKCLQATEAAAGSGGGSTAPPASSNGPSNTATTPTQQLPSNLLPAAAVCDVYESGADLFREDTRQDAFAVLTRRFPELCRGERWAGCAWATVRDLLRSDACACDENVILVAATDWMKRTRLQDKARIQELLSSIRYPRLPRRVLYHLHTTASFRNFPPVQALIEAAIRYHCFRDVPEARDEFTGRQYRSRGKRAVGRHTVCGGEHACCKSRCSSDHTACANDAVTPSKSSSSGSTSHHEIARPNEWGCYGDPTDVVAGTDYDGSSSGGGDSNNNTTSNAGRHQSNASTNTGIADNHNVDVCTFDNGPDLVSESRPSGGNHHHGHNHQHQQHQQQQQQHHNHRSNNHHRAHHQHHHGCRSQHSTRNNRHNNSQHNSQHHQQQSNQHHQQQRSQQHQQSHQQQQNHHHHHQQQQYQHQQQHQQHQQQQQQQQQHQHHKQQQQQQQFQHQHATQCRTCYDGHQRHQGSPVATVPPRVHTPEEGTARQNAGQNADIPRHNMEGSFHADFLRHADVTISAMDRLEQRPVQPPPFTRV